MTRVDTPTFDVRVYVDGQLKLGSAAYTDVKGDLSQPVLLDAGRWTVQIVCKNTFVSCAFLTDLWLGDACARYRGSMSQVMAACGLWLWWWPVALACGLWPVAFGRG